MYPGDDEYDITAISRIGAGPRLDGPPIFQMPPDVPRLDKQLDIDFPPVNDLDERTREWLRANPEIWALFYLMVRTCVNKCCKFAMKMLVEVARWQHIRSSVNPDQNRFKISNDYTSYIIRLMTHFHPEVSDLVSLKEVRNHVRPSDDTGDA